MTLGYGTLATYGQGLLDLVVDGFTQAGITLPEAQYLAPGVMPVWDGEQVTVQLVRLFPGNPGQDIGTYQRPPGALLSVEYVILILRSTPVLDGNLVWPGPDDLNASAVSNWGDLLLLGAILEAAVADDAIVDAGVPITVNPVQPVGTEGGLVGVQATVAFSLAGAR